MREEIENIVNLDKMLHCYTGFSPKNTIFTSSYNNFRGESINVVIPNVTMFTYTYTYPNGSKFRSGPDVSAAKYLSEALNFTLR